MILAKNQKYKMTVMKVEFKKQQYMYKMNCWIYTVWVKDAAGVDILCEYPSRTEQNEYFHVGKFAFFQVIQNGRSYDEIIPVDPFGDDFQIVAEPVGTLTPIPSFQSSANNSQPSPFSNIAAPPAQAPMTNQQHVSSAGGLVDVDIKAMEMAVALTSARIIAGYIPNDQPIDMTETNMMADQIKYKIFSMKTDKR